MNRFLKFVASTAVSFLGLLAGHGFGYFLVEPHAGERAALLADTGHGYAAVVPVYAFTAMFAFVITGIAAGFRHRRTSSVPGNWQSTWLLLSMLQVAAFICLELMEAVGSTSHFEHLLPVLGFGLPAQIAFAALGARLFLAVKKLGARIAARWSSPTPGGSSQAWPIPTIEVCESLFRSATRVRGPPIPSS